MSFTHTAAMEALKEVQEEIAEIMCTLSREKLILLSSLLSIPSEDLPSHTRLSLISLVSNHLVREELGELEDGGMAELRSIRERLNELVDAPVVNQAEGESENSEKEKLEKEISALQWSLIQKQNEIADLSSPNSNLPAVVHVNQMSSEVNPVNSSHSEQRQIIQPGWHKDFKITGQIGEPGQRDRLSFSSLARQIETGLNKGYSEQEIIEAVIRAITPGLQLRSYLEGKTNLTLPTLRRILRSHYQEKGATELYKQLTTEVQHKESPQNFLIRTLDLRQKILFASQEAESGLKYDPALVQSMFLHAVLTGLQSDRIQQDLQPYLLDPNITDEVLLEKLNIACANETEKQNKRKTCRSDRTATVSCAQLEEASELKCKEKQTKQDILSQLRSLSEGIALIKETIQQPVPAPQQCFAVSSQKAEAVPVNQSSQGPAQMHQQTPEWGVSRYDQSHSSNITSSDQQQGPDIEQRQQLWRCNQICDSYMSHPPVFQPQQNSTPLQHPVRFQQCSVLQQYPSHVKPPQFPVLQQPSPAIPTQYAVPTQYSVQPSQYMTPSQFPAMPRQPRYAKARQCFHCQQRRTEEPCSHCYYCGSSEHFLAGCRAKGTRTQRETPLNGNRLLPRDRQ
ncbi:hypothetical protein MHYP_G00051440 [Metynnis hypsauchen]